MANSDSCQKILANDYIMFIDHTNGFLTNGSLAAEAEHDSGGWVVINPMDPNAN